MFWIKNKKIRFTPANPSFFYINVGFKGVYISRTCFPDAIFNSRIQNLANNSEIENSRNKSHAKISKFTVSFQKEQYLPFRSIVCLTNIISHYTGYWLTNQSQYIETSFCCCSAEMFQKDCKMSRLVGKPTTRFPNMSDTNRPVQAQKRARSLRFRIYVEEELYYPSSENKGADQLRGYREADLHLCFRLCRLLVFP